MPARPLATEVVSELPLFLVFAKDAWYCEHQDSTFIQWQIVDDIPEPSDQLNQTLNQAHRIICDCTSWTFEEAEKLAETLDPYQAKTKLVLPVESLGQLAVEGEIPHWQNVRLAQENRILFWTSHLPDSSIIFIRDCFDWQKGTDSLWNSLVAQHLVDGVLIMPSEVITPLLRSQLYQSLLDLFGAPGIGSHLLQGAAIVPQVYSESIRRLLETMYGKQIVVQHSIVKNRALIPFNCRIIEMEKNPISPDVFLSEHLPKPTRWSLITHSLATFEKEYGPDVKTVERIERIFSSDDNTKIEDEIFDDSFVYESLHKADLSSNETTVHGVTDDQKPDSTQGLEVSIPTPSPTLPREAEDLLKEDVRRLFASQGVIRHGKTLEKKVIQRKQIARRSRKRTTVFYLGVSFVVFGLVLAATLGVFQVTQLVARRELLQVAQALAVSQSQGEVVSFGSLPTIMRLLSPQQAFLSPVFALPSIDSGQSMLRVYEDLQRAIALQKTHNERLILTFASFFNGNSGDSSENVKMLVQSGREGQELYDKLVAEAAVLSEPTASQVASAAARLLPVVNSPADQLIARSLLPLLPELAGSQQTRRYAFVLQNSQELRATGGTIESVLLATFSQGRLTETTVYPIYQLDQKLPGQVPPPVDLTRALGEKQWFLQDANWSADGVASNKQIAWFLEKILSQSIDGVVVINTSALPELLRTVGPLEMPEFNEVLTEKNLAERLEFHTEIPRQLTTGERDYRSQLLSHLFMRITSPKPEETALLLSWLKNQFNNRQVIVYSGEPTHQQLFAQLGWTGALNFPICPESLAADGCIVDGVAVVETNVGINRANATIKREQKHTAVLSPTAVSHNREIVYTNTAATAAWPKGDYKVYFRLYSPQRILQPVVSVDSTPLPPNDLQISTTEQGAEMAFVLTIPHNSTKKLSVQYQTPLSQTDKLNYVFYEQRQPGVTDSIPPLTIQYPINWQATATLPKVEVVDLPLTFPAAALPQQLRIVQFSSKQ